MGSGLKFGLLALALSVAAVPSFGAVIITTATGNGADTYVTNDSKNSDTETHGTETSMEIRQYDGVRTRIDYLRFDLSGISGDTSGATLSLTFTGSNRTRTLNVYGLTDNATDDNWSEADTSYSNAPGMAVPTQGDNAGYFAIDSSKLTLLGTLSVVSTAGTYTSDPSTLNLDSFLSSDTNGLVTLVVAYNGSDSNADYHIATKENIDGTAFPTLTLPNATTGTAVPEPASLGALAVGGLALLARRRRSAR